MGELHKAITFSHILINQNIHYGHPFGSKANEKQYGSAFVQMVQPIFDSMFSDMVRYPRASLVLRPAHQVPQSIDTSYKGKVK